MESAEAVMIEIPEDISPAEWEELLQGFLDEGVARSRELLMALDMRFDVVQLGLQTHAWAEDAAQVGFHHITELALRAQHLLGEVPVLKSDVRARLSDLHLAFSHARDSRSVPVPEHIARAVQGKSVALIGFAPEQADRACAVLGRVGARPRLYPAGYLDAQSTSECDLVVFRVGPETDGATLRVAAEGRAAGKLLLAGERRYLMALPPAIQFLAAEYLVEHWDPEELLLRLALSVSRKETAASCAPGRESPARKATEEPRHAMTGPTVLIVDDEPVILALLEMTLRKNGLRCGTADNGLDALRLIRTEQPRVVVLDVNMPGLDGYGVLAAVRAEKLPALVILLTARQREEDILRGFQLGADDYLVKPFNPPELLARIKRLLYLTDKAAA